jgi:Ran GTPase-activating protein (RanGAP) involved in mRNA processing and transport
MSDVDSDADSISDSSNAHISDDDDGDEDSSISPAVRVLCDRLRLNDPNVVSHDSFFTPFRSEREYSVAEWIAVFQALKKNTSVKHIRLWLHGFTKRSANIAAKCLESSKTLQTIDLCYDEFFQELPSVISLLLRALSRCTSVSGLIIYTKSIRFASVAFQELLTCTQTLQKLKLIGSQLILAFLDEADMAAIISGFANNTTLRELKIEGYRANDLAPVLTALQEHPALRKIHLTTAPHDYLPSLSGLDLLLRSQDSKVKELILEQVDTRTVGLQAVFEELERNTKVTMLEILNSALSRENVQQLKVVLRLNTALESLDLESSGLGRAGLAEIAPALYSNTSIKALDLSSNYLDDTESANVLRELIRLNKTITSLCIARNAFGRNATAVGSISDGVRSNTTLQHLNLSSCGLDDKGISVLANALGIRNAGLLEIDLSSNEITSVGVRALVDDSVGVTKLLTKLCLLGNPIRSEGATILANALGRSAMLSLKLLDLGWCHIDDDGFVALVSTMEQNTSMQILDLEGNHFGERGLLALAESLPNIKGLQQISITGCASFQLTLPLLREGFRKNDSLVEVNVHGPDVTGEFLQEIKFLGQRNRFTPLLKASDPSNASPPLGVWSRALAKVAKFFCQRNRFTPLLKASDPPDASLPLGIWSRALAKVATEPDVLFHVLCNKPKLVARSVGVSKKRRRNDHHDE